MQNMQPSLHVVRSPIVLRVNKFLGITQTHGVRITALYKPQRKAAEPLKDLHKEMESAGWRPSKEDASEYTHNLKRRHKKAMSEAEPRIKEAFKAILDRSKVSAPQRVIVEVFAWAAAMVLACSIGSFLGIYILSPLYSITMPKYVAALLAYIVMPLGIYAAIRKKERNFEKDNNIRRMIFAASFVQGTVAGYTISDRDLGYQPIAFLTPVAVSVGYVAAADRARGDRYMIVGGALTAALALNLAVGSATGQLSASYEFLALGYTVLAGIVLQLLIHDAHWTRGHVYQYAVNAFFVIFKGMVFGCFGTSTNENIKEKH